MKNIKIIMLFLLNCALLKAMDEDKEKFKDNPPKCTSSMLVRKSKSASFLEKSKDKNIHALEEEPQSLRQSLLSIKWEELKLRRDHMELRKALIAFVQEQAKEGAMVNLDFFGDDISFSVVPPKKD